MACQGVCVFRRSPVWCVTRISILTFLAFFLLSGLSFAGTLSGSYTQQSCTPGCTTQSLTWNTNCAASATAIAAGGTRALTNANAGYSGSATATCNAGGSGVWTLSGTSCNAIVNGACGSAHGGSTTSAPSSSLCNSGSATSVSGTGPYTWSCNGSSGGSNASCSSNRSCTGTPWGTVAHGYSGTAYSSSAPAGPCTSYDQTRTCNQGSMSGTYTYTSCTNGCTGTPWGSVASGYSGTAYSTSTPAGPCTSYDQTRTCTNGTMSGTYTYTSCTNGCAAGTANWNGSTTGCSGTYTAKSSGQSQSVTNTVSGKSGSVTVTCTAGSIGQSSATCTAAGASCASVTKSWTGTYTCSTATGTGTHGQTKTLTVYTKIRDGSCTTTCNNGTWSACSSAYCEYGYGGSSSCSTC